MVFERLVIYMEKKINFSHRSVLLDECIDGLNIKPDGIYVDGTAGGGGHSLEIAKKLTAQINTEHTVPLKKDRSLPKLFRHHFIPPKRLNLLCIINLTGEFVNKIDKFPFCCYIIFGRYHHEYPHLSKRL